MFIRVKNVFRNCAEKRLYTEEILINKNHIIMGQKAEENNNLYVFLSPSNCDDNSLLCIESNLDDFEDLLRKSV
jgi:hypothetical protein